MRPLRPLPVGLPLVPSEDRPVPFPAELVLHCHERPAVLQEYETPVLHGDGPKRIAIHPLILFGSIFGCRE